MKRYHLVAIVALGLAVYAGLCAQPGVVAGVVAAFMVAVNWA